MRTLKSILFTAAAFAVLGFSTTSVAAAELRSAVLAPSDSARFIQIRHHRRHRSHYAHRTDARVMPRHTNFVLFHPNRFAYNPV